MRAILIVILLGIGRSASACPVEGLCVRAPALEARHHAFAAGHQVALAPAQRSEARTGDVPMPWIWQVLKHKVVQQLPRFEQRSFAMHLSPVVVSTIDTVPGVGLEGRF